MFESGRSILEDDGFDDILASRTRGSWDDEPEFESNNDVSPESSVGEPEEILEDLEEEVPVENPPSPVNHAMSSLFLWPFRNAEQNTRMEASQANDDAPEPPLLKVASSETTKSEELPTTELVSMRVELKEEEDGIEVVPFDERIPPSDGIQVPFHECPLKVETFISIGSKEINEKEEEDYGDVLAPIEEEDSDASKNSRYECLEITEEEEESSEKENASSDATPWDQRSRALMEGTSSRPQSSIDDLVANLETLARRLDALSDGIEECRSIDSASFSVHQINSKCSTECADSLLRTLSAEREYEFRPETRNDEVEQSRSADCLSEECRSEEELLVPTGRDSKMYHPPSVSHKSTPIKRDIEDLADPSFDEIQEIRAAESANSILQGAPSLEETPPSLEETPPSLEETLPSLEETPPSLEETPPSLEETPPSLEEPSPSLEEASPSLEETSPSIKATSPSSDEISPSHDETSVTPSILKTTPPASHDEVSEGTSSKKVSFSEQLYETCPSSHSELDFDYMRHSFDEDNVVVDKMGRSYRRVIKDSQEYEDASVDYYPYEYESRRRSRSWFSLLAQAK